jgi:hypothetical protein
MDDKQTEVESSDEGLIIGSPTISSKFEQLVRKSEDSKPPMKIFPKLAMETKQEFMTPVMEFMSLAEDVKESTSVGSDLTMLPNGKHEVSFQVGDVETKTNVTIQRELDKINISFTLGEKTYTSVLHADGRVYSSILIRREAPFPPYEIQEQSMWRFLSRN